MIIGVQVHTLAMTSSETSDTSALTGSPTVANCIPFLSYRVDDQPRSDQGACRCYFSGGNVVIERAAATTIAIEATVIVVEFDPAVIDVQQGTFSMADSVASDSVTLSAVDLSAAWAVHYAEAASPDEVAHGRTRTYFGSTTSLVVERNTANTQNTCNGEVYVAEALGGEWTVDAFTGALSGTADSDTVGTVVLADTFCLFSSENNSLRGRQLEDSVDVYMGSTTTINYDRSYSSGDDYASFVVEGSSLFVQHETLTYSTPGASSDSNTLGTSIDASLSSAHVGNYQTGGQSDDGSSVCKYVELTLSATTILGETGGSGAATSQVINVNVIEWPESSAPAAFQSPVFLGAAF